MIRDGEILLENAKISQNEYQSKLNEIKREKHKLKTQGSGLHNIEVLYKSQQAVIKFFDDCFSVVPEANIKQLRQKDSKY